MGVVYKKKDKKKERLANRMFKAFSIAHYKKFKKVFDLSFALFELGNEGLFFRNGGEDVI
jgi:hypothetical protein